MARIAVPAITAMAAITAIAASGCLHVPKPVAVMLGPQRELLVRAEVNDRPAILQLDTGASTTSFTPTARRVFRLRGARPVAGLGAGGALAHAEWVMVNKLAVAGELHRGVMATLVDLDTAGAAIDGVLGMNVLGDYAIEIDLAARLLTLHRSANTVARTDELVAIDYRPLHGGQIALAITINGRPAIAVLDLGANRTFANRLALDSDDPELTIIAAVGADRHPLAFHSTGNVRIALSALTLRAASVWIHDLPIFDSFGLADQPAVILGTDVLAGRRIVIDPFHHKVYLSR